MLSVGARGRCPKAREHLIFLYNPHITVFTPKEVYLVKTHYTYFALLVVVPCAYRFFGAPDPPRRRRGQRPRGRVIIK